MLTPVCKIFLFFFQVKFYKCFIINSRNQNPCKGLDTTAETMFGIHSEGEKLVEVSQRTTIHTSNAFRGQTVSFRCHQQNSDWFWSNKSPFSRRTHETGLSPVSSYGQCLQRRFFKNVDVLEVNAQSETEGFFICTERNHLNQRKVWAHRAIFHLTMYQNAIETYLYSFHGYFPLSCMNAEQKFNVEETAFVAESISYHWGAIRCKVETVWHCPTMLGYLPSKINEWKIISTMAVDLKIEESPIFLYTGPMLQQTRIRLKYVRLARGRSITFRFVAQDLDATEYVENVTQRKLDPFRNLGNFVLEEAGLCEEILKSVKFSTDQYFIFNWIILEPALQLVEFPGGFQVEAKGLLPQIFNSEVAGIIVVGEKLKKQVIRTIQLEVPILPEEAIDRKFPRGLSSMLSKSGGDRETVVRSRKTLHTCINLSENRFEIKPVQMVPQVKHLTLTPVTNQPQSILVTVDTVLETAAPPDTDFYHLQVIAKTIYEKESQLMPILSIRWRKKDIQIKALTGRSPTEISWNLSNIVMQQKWIDSKLTLRFLDLGQTAEVAFSINSTLVNRKSILLFTPIEASLELIRTVSQHRRCVECFMCVNVDRRGVYWTVDEKMQSKQMKSPRRKPVNSREGPIAGVTREARAHVTQTLRIVHHMLSNFTRTPPELILGYMRHQNAASNIKIFLEDRWLICPEGHRLAMINPPLCLPCAVNTRAVVFETSSGALMSKRSYVKFDGTTSSKLAVFCEICPRGFYQNEPGQIECHRCTLKASPFCTISPFPYGNSSDSLNSTNVEERFQTPMPNNVSIPSTVFPMRQIHIPNSVALIFLACCLMSLLAILVYFTLESISFMLLGIAWGRWKRRMANKTLVKGHSLFQVSRHKLSNAFIQPIKWRITKLVFEKWVNPFNIHDEKDKNLEEEQPVPSASIYARRKTALSVMKSNFNQEKKRHSIHFLKSQLPMNDFKVDQPKSVILNANKLQITSTEEEEDEEEEEMQKQQHIKMLSILRPVQSLWTKNEDFDDEIGSENELPFKREYANAGTQTYRSFLKARKNIVKRSKHVATQTDESFIQLMRIHTNVII